MDKLYYSRGKNNKTEFFYLSSFKINRTWLSTIVSQQSRISNEPDRGKEYPHDATIKYLIIIVNKLRMIKHEVIIAMDYN